MYILSRDRLNMDLDRSCLELMIRLLELDQDRGGVASVECNLQFSAREIAKMKEKIRKLCDTVHNKHLDLENITVRRRERAGAGANQRPLMIADTCFSYRRVI